MIIFIDSSVLISASLFWSYESTKRQYRLRGKGFQPCNDLFDFLKNHKSIQCIITKTAEKEAENALNKSVIETLKWRIERNRIPDFVMKIKFMILQDIITNASMDKLEGIVEEYSTRLPIDISERNKIKENELKPFFDEVVPTTNRYIKGPHIPKTIKGSKLGREDIYEEMIKSLPKSGIIYKSYPEDRDLTLMAEATLIFRKCCKDKSEKLFVASLDNHFKPNPKCIGSFLSPKRRFSGDVDSTVRDMLHNKFGFKGEHPIQLLEELKKINSL